ncbi:hypothetical protein [Amycolatopsis aidingensis]|uniref:hypothetical protein n=1 Tax=Amycolatopsis aidingensis TaxID=2842453 RepID=UPI001C0E4194|nr:hypothetical protein [Amycolatopsis aidingensis]
MKRGGEDAGLEVARAELVLAGPAHRPLKSLPVRPDDPLQSLANALGDVRPDLGESVDVCVDLIPLTPAKISYLARKTAREGAGQERVVGRVCVLCWVGLVRRCGRSWPSSFRRLAVVVPAGPRRGSGRSVLTLRLW